MITFYKYVEVKDPEKLKSDIIDFCREKDILGRILVGEEGINGAASAKNKEILEFQAWLKSNKDFSDLTFRVYECERNAYHKLVVRVRKEIVAFGKNVDLRNSGKYVSPKELKEMYDKKEDFVIIDARNDYEFDVGHFDDAVRLPIRNFRDLPDEVEKLKLAKDKKVVMYCTGGIRCEKASAFLKEQGFNDVSHLKGGIIEFNNEFPRTNFKGANFVFDDRLIDSEEILLDCKICGKDAKNYTNCYNLDCDKLYACCNSCLRSYRHCCSSECMNSKRQRKDSVKHRTIGKVLNYFSKPKVAHIKLLKELRKGEKIKFVGKTTKEVTIDVANIHTANGEITDFAKSGDEITLIVNEKVRKNDAVLI